ncbi:Lymphocyte antigen 86 [Lonchura striata]|uniref:Lymphocyte antigen 86 n=1 Tax=Lonchura striata TaxID=40157 RepID=A0A218UYI4_9PASE|nr:Lymphocyte antigen 86 [Lonchura striata domestica]
MKTSNTLLFILVLLYINASTQWPTHTVCKEDNLEIYYKSCDPQQDFALSIDQCSDIATHTFNIKAAMVLGYSIKELYVKLNMIVNGKTVLTYSETLCGPGHSKLIFCGKKKGGNLGVTNNSIMRGQSHWESKKSLRVFWQKIWAHPLPPLKHLDQEGFGGN